MPKHSVAIVAAIVLIVVCCTHTPAQVGQAVRMSPQIEFPHAGIALAVPEGFVLETPDTSVEVMRSVRKEHDKAASTVTLMAFPVNSEVTSDEFVDAMIAEQQGGLAVRNFELLRKVPMTVAGIKGTGRLMKYTFRGVETVAASVGFIRQGKPDTSRICYVLLVESEPERQTMLLTVLGEVIKTARLIPFRHPIDIPITFSADAVGQTDMGCSIHPPLGWHAAASGGVVQLGQTDYLHRGQVTLTAHVMTRSVPSETTGKEHIENCAQLAGQRMAENGNVTEVSQGQAYLAGKSGWQFILRLDPKSPTTATAPATSPATESPQPLFVAHRAVCVERDPAGREEGPPRGTSYDLVLIARGPNTDAVKAQAVMDKLAEGFEFADPVKSAPPTTAPAEESTTRKKLAPRPKTR